jgi:hypothetical protein
MVLQKGVSLSFRDNIHFQVTRIEGQEKTGLVVQKKM